MARWRVAKSISDILKETNAAAPGRSKKGDGTIGDVAHSKRVSDHNPNGAGVVCAVDLTQDPKRADMGELARFLVEHPHPALKYVIWNKRIASFTYDWKWKPYSGSDPHTGHIHISVGPTKYDLQMPWGIKLAWHSPTLVKAGERGDDIAFLQRILGVRITGVADAATVAAIKRYQGGRKLATDGVVGPKTWSSILR